MKIENFCFLIHHSGKKRARLFVLAGWSSTMEWKTIRSDNILITPESLQKTFLLLLRELSEKRWFVSQNLRGGGEGVREMGNHSLIVVIGIQSLCRDRSKMNRFSSFSTRESWEPSQGNCWNTCWNTCSDQSSTPVEGDVRTHQGGGYYTCNIFYLTYSTRSVFSNFSPIILTWYCFPVM